MLIKNARFAAIWAVLFLINGVRLSPLHTASSSAPYFYYFSQSEHGIVIERANGADHRVLGQGILPNDHTAADLSWSPSGRWLAWRSWQNTDYAVYDQLLWIISSDGKTRRTLLEHKPGIAHISWSPTGEWLAVSRLTDPRNGFSDLYLVNVEKNQITLTFRLPDTVDHAPVILWSPDSTQAYFYSWAGAPVYVLTTSGTIAVYAVPENVSSCQPIFGVDTSLAGPVWGNGPGVAYLRPDGKKLIAENAVVRAEADPPTKGLIIDNFWWSHDGTYALLMGRSPCDASDQHMELWLLSTIDSSLHQIGKNVLRPYDLALCCNKVFGHSLDQTSWTWAPGEDKALFMTDDKMLHVIAASSVEDQQIQIPDLDTSRWIAYWQPDGKSIFVEAKTTLNQPPLEPDGPVYRYQLADSSLTLIPNDRYTIDIGPHSADGRYVGYQCKGSDLSFSEPTQGCILDLTTGHQIPLKPLNAEKEISGAAMYRAFFPWSPHQNWELFAAAYSTNTEHYFYGVVNADGTVQRELAAGSSGWRSLDWLPDNVHLGDTETLP